MIFMSKFIEFLGFLNCFIFNRDDTYENIEVKYKMIQQKDDQVKLNIKIELFISIFLYLDP